MIEKRDYMLIHLDNEYFELINKRIKTVELRLNDEKRRKLKIDDIIEFENRKNGEKIRCKITNIYYSNNFDKLYEYFYNNNISLEKLGNISVETLSKFYTKEQQEKYGVVGIEIELIKQH